MTSEPVKLSTRIDTIRDTIPYDLISLTLLLQELGWQLTIKTTTRVDKGVRALVIAERGNWLGMSMSNYEFSYLTDDLQEHSIIQTIRKLTELCYRLADTFTNTFPAEYVANDGFIYEDAGRTAAATRGHRELLDYLSAQHRVEMEGKNRPPLYLRFSFLNLRWDEQKIIISQDNLLTLEGYIRARNNP